MAGPEPTFEDQPWRVAFSLGLPDEMRFPKTDEGPWQAGAFHLTLGQVAAQDGRENPVHPDLPVVKVEPVTDDPTSLVIGVEVATGAGRIIHKAGSGAVGHLFRSQFDR